MSVPLAGRPAFFDDLRYAPELGRVIAAPEGVGKLFVIDPATLDVTTFATTAGTASADADAHMIYAADRASDSIAAYDATTGTRLGSIDLDGNPDYVRAVAGGGEIWVTLPGLSRIDIVSAGGDPFALSHVASIDTPGSPEGLAFGDGRAYTQSGGSLIAIDREQRTVIGKWSTGCGGSHGFPQVDDSYGLVVAGCRADGGAAVLSQDGEKLSGFAAGGGSAVLSYNAARHHLFVRGDPGGTLAMLAVCPDGGMTAMAEPEIPSDGHASTVDSLGNVWVADATTGGLTRITDPFDATE